MNTGNHVVDNASIYEKFVAACGGGGGDTNSDDGDNCAREGHFPVIDWLSK